MRTELVIAFSMLALITAVFVSMLNYVDTRKALVDTRITRMEVIVVFKADRGWIWTKNSKSAM